MDRQDFAETEHENDGSDCGEPVEEATSEASPAVEELSEEELAEQIRRRQEKRRSKRSGKLRRRRAVKSAAGSVLPDGVKVPENIKEAVNKGGRSVGARLKRSNPVIMAVAIIILLMAAGAIKTIISLELEHHRLVKENRELYEQRNTLKIELKNVNSREYIEEQARKQLRLVNPDEIMFVFPED